MSQQRQMRWQSLAQRGVICLLITLLVACAQTPIVKLGQDQRSKIKTIAIIEIAQPPAIAVFAESGAAALAGAIPGLGVLGAAIVAGTTTAVEGAMYQPTDQVEFNHLIPEERRQFAAEITKRIQAELTAKGYIVTVQTGTKIPFNQETKKFDYKNVSTNADAFVHLRYVTFGYFSRPFSNDFRPNIVFDVKVVNASSKEIIFSDRYKLAETDNEVNTASSVGVGKLVHFDGTATLKNNADKAYSTLVEYQSVMARRFSENFNGNWAAPASAVSTTTGAVGVVPIAAHPVATGVDIKDVNAVPYLTDRGRNAYLEWLLMRYPRAFAVAPNGKFSSASGSSHGDPREWVLKACSEAAKQPCILYAVDGDVVWQGTAAPRQDVVNATPTEIARPAAVAVIDVADVNAVPNLTELGRNAYLKWLVQRYPRAFALAQNGQFAAAWGNHPTDPGKPADPGERALLNCAALAQQPCKLYAVDGSVVWSQTQTQTVVKAATP